MSKHQNHIVYKKMMKFFDIIYYKYDISKLLYILILRDVGEE